MGLGAATYVELRCRSAFSFLDGGSAPEDLVEAAVAGGYSALALSDRDGLYGAPRFFAAARKHGLRAIVGAEVTLVGAPPVLLLAENRVGYRNLCRLLTRMKEGLPKQRPREAPWRSPWIPDAALPLSPSAQTSPKPEPVASLSLLAAHHEGLFLLGGAFPRADLPALIAAFGKDRVFLEKQRHFDVREAHAARAVSAQAESLGIQVVATNDVRYASPAARRVHDVFLCLRHGLTIEEIGRKLAPNAERWLKPAVEMARLFADAPKVLATTAELAARCGFTLADLGYEFPTFPVPPGETQQSYLVQQTWQNAPSRFVPFNDRVRQQLTHELDIIGKLDLAGYFLVVWDIVCFARRKGIFVQGRGSAANSAVCFALGITAIDPVKMELLFERFLSEERVTSAQSVADRLPDIDLDLPSGERREAVIQHVYKTYGPHGAAMTANVITYRPRLAVRDAGRAFGFSEEQLGRISKLLPSWIHEDARPLGEIFAAAGFPLSEERTRLCAEVATSLLNLPRHLGQHSGGMVLSAGRLDEIVPLEPASMPGRIVVAWDKDDCADLGLIKVDLLGLCMLAVLEEALPLLQRHHGIELDYAKLPQDPAVYSMLQAADTVGVFQVESRAQMATLPRMRPENFYDLVVEVAIIRPGPIVGRMVNPYLERRRDPSLVRYPHECLRPILERTLGVPIFQEQLIRMAMAAADFSGGQAEELRRAMGFKRSMERMTQIESSLRAGMAAKGIVGAAQEEIILGIKSFALYGFPESHAASFALIAYASAYLKAHHPAVFLCALLNNQPLGFYHPAILVTDAARHGIETRAIDVNLSGWDCDLEGPEAVRLGLRYVAGLREVIGRRIEAERRARPFSSLGDFEQRARPERDELTTLAEVGAFSSLVSARDLPRGLARRQALWQVEALGRSGPLFSRATRASHKDSQGEALAPLSPMSEAEETQADFRHSGITLGPHPMTHARAALARRGVVTAAELREIPDGRRAAVAGVVIVRQRPGTAKGFVFITLEDETGFANAIVTPPLFEAHRGVIVRSPVLLLEGRVQNQYGVSSLKADGFEDVQLATPALSAVDLSHDFH